MDIKQRHILETNRLAARFSCIIQGFQLIATIVYQAERVGFPFINTLVMSILQILIIGVTIYSYVRYKNRTRGRYLTVASLCASYFVVMLGSVHVPYMWAFGIGILILTLLFSDLKITIIAGIYVSIVNILYFPFFMHFSVEAMDRKNMVMTDAVFTILYSLMAIFYVRLSGRQNVETIEEIEAAAIQQEENVKVMSHTGVQIASKLEDANDAMEALADKVSSSAESAEQISQSITMTAEAIQT